MEINEIIKRAHDNAVEKGFYDCPECDGTGRECESHKNNLPCDEGVDRSFDNSMCREYCQNACDKCKGSGKADKNIGELLMLIVSELGEALEAHMKGRYSDLEFADMESENHTEKSKIITFERCIKDTFEDELADTVIRIADIMGYLKYNYTEHGACVIAWMSENIAQKLLQICKHICSIHNYNPSSKDLMIAIDLVFMLAGDMNIDLDKHIDLKMQYNATRPHKHGKRY